MKRKERKEGKSWKRGGGKGHKSSLSHFSPPPSPAIRKRCKKEQCGRRLKVWRMSLCSQMAFSVREILMSASENVLEFRLGSRGRRILLNVSAPAPPSQRNANSFILLSLFDSIRFAGKCFRARGAFCISGQLGRRVPNKKFLFKTFLKEWVGKMTNKLL